MCYLGIILVGIVNGVVLFFAAFLAAGADGNAEAVTQVWLFGYSAIAATTIVSFVLCARGKRAVALVSSFITLPGLYLALLLGLMADGVIESHRPNSPEFERSCKSAGAVYFSKPSAPVHSFAYDWPHSTFPPQTNYFNFDERGNVRNLSGGIGLKKYPEAIEFTEARCCRFEGRPTNGSGEFIRHPRNGDNYGIPDITADVVVTITTSTQSNRSLKADITETELLVVDRRDGRKLAVLKYTLDDRERRGCGATSKGTMDERAFVLRAIGVE